MKADISIHSPYTGRDAEKGGREEKGKISIHSPYTGRDTFTTRLNTEL